MHRTGTLLLLFVSGNRGDHGCAVTVQQWGQAAAITAAYIQIIHAGLLIHIDHYATQVLRIGFDKKRLVKVSGVCFKSLSQGRRNCND